MATKPDYSTPCQPQPPLTNSWFSLSRSEGYPTRYTDQRNAAHVDVLTAGLIFAFLILAICSYAILPAFKPKRGFQIFLYITLSLFIGGVVVGNFGHEWELAEAKIRTPYRAGSAEEIDATLGLHIALRGINITMKGEPTEKEHSVDLRNEKIDYNEHFSWEWIQGRFGFGKYAGRFSQEFREKVNQGLPYPILQVAEYFTFDGEWIRFGRHYRQAGYYAHIFMWTAFPLWILTNVLFFMGSPHKGSFLLLLTGLSQLTAILIWTYARNPIEIIIPFEAQFDHHSPSPMEDRDVTFHTRFGPDYFVVLVNGLLCAFLALVTFVCNECFPDETCAFFGIDPVSMYFEYYSDPGATLAPTTHAPEGKAERVLGVTGTRDPPTTLEDERRGTMLRRRDRGTYLTTIQNSFRAKPTPRGRQKPNISRDILEMDDVAERTRLLSPPKITHTRYVMETDSPPPLPKVSPRSYPPARPAM